MRRFAILGPFEVVVEGSVHPLGRRQERALLALLLTEHGRVVARSALVDALWPTGPPQNSADVLRVYVSRLRKVIADDDGHGLSAHPAGYRLDLGGGELDADQFRALTARGRAAAGAGDPGAAAACFAEALALWRGAALADLADVDALAAVAAELEETHRSVEEDRMEALLAVGGAPDLIGELDAFTRSHPLRERGWELRMRALYVAGRQAEALAVYRQVRELLVDQHGLEPGPGLARLQQEILRRGMAPTPYPPAPTRPDATSDSTPYVGREAERTELRRRLDAASSGWGALVLIGGEPGVGKTRLAQELMFDADARGMQVFVGHSYEMSGAAPWVAVVEILEAALSRAPSPAAWREFLGDDAPEIARLLPKLRRLCPDIPTPLSLPPEQERRMLFAGVRDVVARSARRQPLLLVFDDLQWADDPTLRCLEHLAEHLAEMPVLVLATYRDTEVEVGRPLAATFEDLRRRRLAHWMDLGRLDRPEVAGMLTALAGRPVPAAVDAIHAATDGNPFFVEELWTYLAAEDRIFDDAGNVRPDVGVRSLDVPGGLRLILGRRLARLSAGTRPVLAAAAVAGRAFSVELLEQVEALLERGATGVLEAVEEAARARIVVPAPDTSGEDRYLFAHELIRQTVLAELSLTRRRRLHAALAAARERHHHSDLERHAAAIAHHLDEAGDAGERRLEYLLLAGRHAIASAAFEEALHHLEPAADLCGRATPQQRANLFADLAQAREGTGQMEAAVAARDEALSAFEALGDVEAIGRLCVAAGYSMIFLGRWAEAAQVGERGLAALGEQVVADRGLLLGIVAADLGFGGGVHAVASAMVAEELAIAEQLGDRRLLAGGLLARSVVHFGALEHRQLFAVGTQAVSMFRAEGDLVGLIRTAGMLCDSHAYLGRFADAEGWTGQFLPIAARLGDQGALLQLRRFAGLAPVLRTGDLDALAALGDTDRAFAENNGMPWASGWAWQGWARFLRGDWREALPLFREAVARDSLLGYDVGLLLDALAYLGESDEAAAVIQQWSLPLCDDPESWTIGRSLLLAAAPESLVLLGKHDDAAALYPLLLAMHERTGVICPGYDDARLYERSAGIAAAAGEQWDLADAHFQTALRQAAELPHPIEAAHTGRWYGRMLVERGRDADRERAAAVLAAAVDTYDRLCIVRHRDLTAALLREL